MWEYVIVVCMERPHKQDFEESNNGIGANDSLKLEDFTKEY
ncbi:hypothetical protein [Clostridium estertheticum]|nr:hypothetical protein [Clostridium estertheticum]